MACPGCGCKVTYHYNSEDEDYTSEGEEYERCANCGFIFDVELAAPEEDDTYHGGDTP